MHRERRHMKSGLAGELCGLYLGLGNLPDLLEVRAGGAPSRERASEGELYPFVCWDGFPVPPQ